MLNVHTFRWLEDFVQGTVMLETALDAIEIVLKSDYNYEEWMALTFCLVTLLKSHMHLTQYVDQVCMICGSVKVTLCPLTSSVNGVHTCTTPSTHISVDLVIVL